MRWTDRVAVAGVFLLVMAVAGCQPDGAADSDEASAAPAPRSVLVSAVERDDIVTELVYGAELLPSSEVRLFSSLMDRIVSFPWQNGDEIEKGEIVALIRKDGLELGLEQMAAELQALDVQIRNLVTELKRAKELLAQEAYTQQTFDSLKANLDATRAKRKALVAGRGQMAATAENAIILAPFSGVLSNKMLEEGDMASPQMPLARLIVLDPLKVELKLMESHIGSVSLGQEVLLELDAHPEKEFTATVNRIMPYVNPETRTITVELTVLNPRDPDSGERLLKPGMYGRARLFVDRREGVLVAPEPALLLDAALIAASSPGEERRRAFVVDEDNLARRRQVLLGRREGGRWEVLEGLDEGERLIVRGHHGLRDGHPVRIEEIDP